MYTQHSKPTSSNEFDVWLLNRYHYLVSTSCLPHACLEYLSEPYPCYDVTLVETRGFTSFCHALCLLQALCLLLPYVTPLASCLSFCKVVRGTMLVLLSRILPLTSIVPLPTLFHASRLMLVLLSCVICPSFFRPEVLPCHYISQQKLTSTSQFTSGTT